MSNDFILQSEKVGKERPTFFYEKPTFEFEKELFQNGNKIIIGVDEAGRGALAGPLAVGFVIYDKSFIMNKGMESNFDVNDSKKMTHKKRLSSHAAIKEKSLLNKTVFVSPELIDKININRATEYALKKFLKYTKIKPDVIIMDGNFKFNLDIKFIPIIKGDSRSISIASASIEAKVKRDFVMDRLDSLYPQFDFKSNKGYGTKSHMKVIKEYGFSKIHRKSYEPVKSMISGQERFSFDEN